MENCMRLEKWLKWYNQLKFSDRTLLYSDKEVPSKVSHEVCAQEIKQSTCGQMWLVNL